nr:hypothetical protein [Mucilaginibacter sp. SP1R1]
MANPVNPLWQTKDREYIQQSLICDPGNSTQTFAFGTISANSKWLII